MATQIIKQRICDICQDGNGVKTYRLGLVGDGRGATADLCGVHLKPIEEAMAAVPKGRSSSGLRKAPPVRTEAQVRKLRKH